MVYNFKDNIPIYLQIMKDIKQQLVSGKLKKGSQVDSVRNLALYYGANPNTVQKALIELERENLLESERTAGRFVCADEDAIKEIKLNLVNEISRNYINEMSKIGYDFEQVINYLKEMEGEKNV